VWLKKRIEKSVDAHPSAKSVQTFEYLIEFLSNYEIKQRLL
jgi:hypothetical protein